MGSTSGMALYRYSTGWGPLAIGAAFQVVAGSLWPNIRSYVLPLTGVASSSGGGIATWQPPESGPVVITRLIVDVTTISTGAANLSVGQGSSATTSYTNLITASDVHSATGIFDSLTLQVTASAALALLMPAANYITFSGSASTAGMVAEAIIEYWKP